MKKVLILFTLMSFLPSCDIFNKDIDPVLIEPEITSDGLLAWAELCLDVIKNSPNNSPTYASRSLGYIGLTMYETVVAGSANYQSIGSELNGLGQTELEGNLDWEIAQSAGVKLMLEKLYAHAPDRYKRQIDNLYEADLEAKRKAGLSGKVIKSSINYGEKVAKKIYKWSRTDNGDEGFQRTFDSEYVLPKGLQYWIAPFKGGQSPIAQAMHPYWGRNRNFVKKNAAIPNPTMIPFSEDSSSAYFKEMATVYRKNISLTDEEKRTALWWGDDPASSTSPPGHSFYLAMQLIANQGSKLMEASAVLAQVGMATADAFINTWRCKYHYHTERPTGFIIRNIDKDYWQFWPEPPFPSFSSGHSTQIAAAVTVLINHYGNDHNVLDEFHKFRGDYVTNLTFGGGLKPQESIAFKPRSFSNLWSIAEECGWSRILGGIHLPIDNVEGLKMGKQIGENVSSLAWER